MAPILSRRIVAAYYALTIPILVLVGTWLLIEGIIRLLSGG